MKCVSLKMCGNVRPSSCVSKRVIVGQCLDTRDDSLNDFLAFMIVGFFAQLVDAALGMGFGVISSSILLAHGIPPVLASASVNAAKLPTTGTAALSHNFHRNINWSIARKLCLLVIKTTFSEHLWKLRIWRW
jgi:hypothetical protein